MIFFFLLRLTFLLIFIHLYQFEAEYRRFALKRNGPGGFLDFYHLLQSVHHIPGVDMLLGYADIQGDLLPINNDENFHKAVSSANPLLRIIITKKGKTRLNPPKLDCVLSVLQRERERRREREGGRESCDATSGWTENCACWPQSLGGSGSKRTKGMPITEA